MRRLSDRVQFAYILLFVIIIFSTVIISYVSGSQKLEDEVVLSNLNMLDQINKRIDGTLSEIDRAAIHLINTNDAQFYYNSPRTQEPSFLMRLSELQNQLNSLKSAHPSIHSIYLYSKRNDTVLSADFHDQTPEQANMGWIEKFRDAQSYYTWTADPIVSDRDLSRHSLTLIRHYPVAEKPEKRTGMIAFHIQEESVARLFADLRFNQNGNVFVINDQGTILSHNDKTRIGQSIASDKYAEDVLSRKDSGSIQYKSGSDAEWVFFSASPYTGWKVVYIVSQKQVSDLFLTIRNILIALAAGMILLSIASVVFVNRKWYHPIEHFIDKIEQLIDKQPQESRSKGRQTVAGLGSLENRIRHVMTSYSDAERQLHESRPALKLQILFDIFTGHRSRYELAKTYFDPIGIYLRPEHFLVMTVELDNRSSQDQSKDMSLYLYAICNVTEELMHADEHALRGAAIQINEFQIAILMNFEGGQPATNESIAFAFAQTLRNAVDLYFKRTISIGIGGHYQLFSDIKLSFQESQQMIHYKMVMGRNSIITRRDITDDTSGVLQVYDLAENLLEAIKQVNGEKAEQVVEGIFHIAADSNFTHHGMVQFAMQLIYRAGKASADEKVTEYLQGEYVRIEQDLETCETIEDMQQLLRAIVSHIIERLLEKQQTKKRTGDTIDQVVLYLNEHFANPDISLQYLAGLFNMSQSYLSKSFKEHTTMNFVDYIIHIRMKEAQTLLLESDLTINQIASKVGYANVTSFMRSFKKIHGLTPSEYRQTFSSSLKK
ncbi:AraC family transcriptional regulator [Paenibacillus daejeonensis]|uniref:AraC family transcriptional regulator n=1 Tax=Paenibacillus daejeonensis TaxID=135193 RepID=UPI000382B1A5|nr:AraC family transcriptional regulator [Paenibacillus daejeonensis]